jgi:hypothetical protein
MCRSPRLATWKPGYKGRVDPARAFRPAAPVAAIALALTSGEARAQNAPVRQLRYDTAIDASVTAMGGVL